MLAGYRLTSEAASDIKGILDYTLDRWGAEQADKYVLQIEQCLHDLVSGRRSGRPFGDSLAEIQVFHCEHHYIFYATQDDLLAVVAILHEAMDLLARLRERME
jgi:plasmid stabilization system protein ParE